MKKKCFLVFALFISSIIISYSQFKEFSFSEIHLNSKKSTRIFITALWCSPCMGKYKVVNRQFKEDTSFNNIVIFDASGFKVSKLSKMEPNYYDSLKSFLIPYKYYGSNGFIVTNLPTKALGKFITDLKFIYPNNRGLDKFWYGDILLISSEGILTFEKVKR